MPESGTSGSVRGPAGNRWLYSTIRDADSARQEQAGPEMEHARRDLKRNRINKEGMLERVRPYITIKWQHPTARSPASDFRPSNIRQPGCSQ